MSDDLHIGQVLRGEARARKNLKRLAKHKRPEIAALAMARHDQLASRWADPERRFIDAAITSVVPGEGQS